MKGWSDSSEREVIAQFFKKFPKRSTPMSVSKNTIKETGHRARLGEIMGQTYPIYACAGITRVISLVHGTF